MYQSVKKSQFSISSNDIPKYKHHSIKIVYIYTYVFINYISKEDERFFLEINGIMKSLKHFTI